jgi:hypothetical protein
VGDCVLAEEVELVPQAVELAASFFVEQQAAEGFVFAVEQEEAALGVPRNDIREENRRGEECPKLVGRAGTLGSDPGMSDLGHARFGCVCDQRIA